MDTLPGSAWSRPRPDRQEFVNWLSSATSISRSWDESQSGPPNPWLWCSHLTFNPRAIYTPRSTMPPGRQSSGSIPT